MLCHNWHFSHYESCILICKIMLPLIHLCRGVGLMCQQICLAMTVDPSILALPMMSCVLWRGRDCMAFCPKSLPDQSWCPEKVTATTHRRPFWYGGSQVTRTLFSILIGAVWWTVSPSASSLARPGGDRGEVWLMEVLQVVILISHHWHLTPQ